MKVTGNPHNSPKTSTQFWKELFVCLFIHGKHPIPKESQQHEVTYFFILFFYWLEAEGSQLAQQPGMNLQDSLAFETASSILLEGLLKVAMKVHEIL